MNPRTIELSDGRFAVVDGSDRQPVAGRTYAVRTGGPDDDLEGPISAVTHDGEPIAGLVLGRVLSAGRAV